MTYIVNAPVQDYNGVVAGVALVQGRYEGPLTPSALAYFQGAGYSVVATEPAAEPEPAAFEPLPGAPAANASKADWMAFWVNDAPEGLRLSEEQAEALTRNQLAEKALGPKGD